MINIPVWILTFNRYDSLNRLIDELRSEGFVNISVLSNHPDLSIYEHNLNTIINHTVINTLNDAESSSWCTRSWNTILHKNFKTNRELIAIQDDTTINHGFGKWILDAREKYDFIWGPAGDQFFYLRRNILETVWWFDERYLACFCGDSDWMRRIYQECDKSKLSIEESHQWGFNHNQSGISQMVNNGDARPWIPGAHVNQHEEFKKCGNLDSVLSYCQDHYMKRWGVSIDDRINDTPRQLLLPNVDWYPWFTKKYGVI